LSTEIDSTAGADLSRLLTRVVDKVILQPTAIEVRLQKYLTRALLLKTPIEETSSTGQEDLLVLTVSAELKRCRGEMRIVAPGNAQELSAARIIPALVKAVVRAREWARLLASGECKDLRSLADRTGLDHRYVSRILPIAFLIPEMVQTILEGRQQPGITLDHLLDIASLDWREQQTALGLSQSQD
jgi:hypothetical protein